MAMQEIAANKHLIYAERYLYWQRRLGLDGSLFTRYLRWLGLAPFYNGAFNGLLQGNLGTSVVYGKPVASVIKEPLLNTVFLNLFATAAALGITLPLGIFCAVKRGSRRDTAVQVGTIVGYSMPVFITAILFIWLFAVKLDIFPVSGMSSVGKDYTGFRAFLDKLYHFALPLIVMTFCSLGGMTRYVRASMTDALRLDCIRTARAKGLSNRSVIYSHAWRNALIPIVSLIIGWLLGVFSGSIMIENIFGLNGIGKVYFDALTANDNEIVLAMQMFYILLALVGNLLVDLAYGLVDPRIRVQK
jgi:peptide/nickel transport system permease protein